MRQGVRAHSGWVRIERPGPARLRPLAERDPPGDGLGAPAAGAARRRGLVRGRPEPVPLELRPPAPATW